MSQMQRSKKKVLPKQEQHRQPGIEEEMKPQPKAIPAQALGDPKLKNKVALITGGDSGIGRAVAIAFAQHGAAIAISYLNEHQDAKETKKLVEGYGQECLLLAGDISEEKNCQKIIQQVIKKFKRLDIVVNNAAEQFPKKSIEEITEEQLDRTFRVNIYSFFFMTKAALPFLKKGSCIINSSSVTAYRGSPGLIDYSATKGAIISFTRSLSHSLVKKGIRVNAVAPGPIWTPLIPATFSGEKVESFGATVPMGRPGQPNEVATSYLFLASEDSSYMTGQVLHPNGGEIVNG